jgi:hypothetical protein
MADEYEANVTSQVQSASEVDLQHALMESRIARKYAQDVARETRRNWLEVALSPHDHPAVERRGPNR